MREIKFRAWYPAKGVMLYPHHPHQSFHRAEPHTETCKGNPILDIMDWNGLVYTNGELVNLEPLQYIGLKDKSGEEIYEGDIVVKECYLWFDNGLPNYRGTVEWIFSAWQVVAHCVNPEKVGISDGINKLINEDGFDDGQDTDWIILGNIYQNPQLLENEK